MDLPRDIRNFRRNVSTRSTVSSSSSLAMEIKRKKIRESMLFLQNEARNLKRCTSLNDTQQIIEDMNLLYIRQISKKIKDGNLQERLDFEVRMRAGAYKLLLASTKREQILNAAKNLLTCNARIRSYMSAAQRRSEQQDLAESLRRRSSDCNLKKGVRVACKGKVAVSGLRIPLFWKDSDHFNNRGNSRRVAIFCLLKIGTEIFDTDMVVVDQSVTDICFEGTTIFNDTGPQFELTLQLYSCAIEEEGTLVNTPKKLARKLRSSFGKTSGKKVCPLVDGGDPDAFLQSNPIPPGARYSLLAYTTLGLDQAEGSFQSHSLIVLQNVESSSWLPLYGNLCCQLVAQPDCMTQDMMSGYLSQQQSIEGLQRCCRLYCVLRAGRLSCYYTPEEIQAKVEPSLTIPINKDTRIRVVDNNWERGGGTRLSLINPVSGDGGSQVFTTDSPGTLQDWLEAFWQHLYDQDQWQHCCNELMRIEVQSPRKPPLFHTKEADSVYNDLSIGSPGKFESLTDIIHNKIEETDGRYLIGQEESEPPHWAALFEGSRPMVVQKTVLSPGKESVQSFSSPISNSSKKRRAPPPPPDRLPYVPPTSTPSIQGKENSYKVPKSRSGRPSLDAKFSSIIQQLQRTHGPARRNAPLGQMEPPQPPHAPCAALWRDLEPDPDHNPESQVPLHPVPAPRHKLRKSFREKINPKAW